MGIMRSVAFVALLVGCTGGGSRPSQDPDYYDRVVEPILLQKCTGNTSGCHAESGALPILSSFDELARNPETLVVGPDGHSMFLDKAVGRTPHGGGSTIAEGSDAYTTLAAWIENGASGLTDGL